MRIEDAERGGGGDRAIGGAAARAQHIGAGGGGERMRRCDHAARREARAEDYFRARLPSFFAARAVPATSASSFFTARSRSIGAMPQLVHG